MFPQVCLDAEDGHNRFFLHSIKTFQFLEEAVIFGQNLSALGNRTPGEETELLMKVVDALTSPLYYLWVKLDTPVGEDLRDGLVTKAPFMQFIEE